MTFTIPRPEWLGEATVARRGENAGFQMYTREGNDAVAEMLYYVFEACEQAAVGSHGMVNLLKRKVRELARTHGEVHDTEPEWAIVDAVNAYCDTRRWAHISRDDF